MSYIFIFLFIFWLNADIAGNIAILKQRSLHLLSLLQCRKQDRSVIFLLLIMPDKDILEKTGFRNFLNKKDLLPADIEWHLIGHLQSNKVKYIVPFISMIQSVDSF